MNNEVKLQLNKEIVTGIISDAESKKIDTNEYLNNLLSNAKLNELKNQFKLNDNELDIFTLIFKNYSDKEMSFEKCLSISSIKKIKRDLRYKLSVENDKSLIIKFNKWINYIH